MAAWVELTNLAILSAGLMLAFLGLMLTISTGMMELKSRRFFILLFSTNFLYIACSLISEVSIDFCGPGFAVLSRVSMFLYSLLAIMQLPMFIGYLLHCCGDVYQKSSLWRFNCFICLIYAAMLIYTQFSDTIYYISDNNEYHRGPYYQILLLPSAVLMIIDLFALYRRRTCLTRRQSRGFWACLLTPLVLMLVQMTTYGLMLVNFGTAVSALILLKYIVEEQRDKSMRLMQEYTKQELEILLLQMRPHFIYNTMTSIYYLCEMDPGKAQKVIGDFTTYLRKNFSAVAKEGLIPFEEELEHTRAYLAVEKVRYEKLLFVEYDIRYTEFELPPLTLQPIVENAVKHGIDPERPSLHLRVAVQKTDREIEIIVEDDGPGFDLSAVVSGGDLQFPAGAGANASRGGLQSTHIGIRNVQKRLEVMCRASMETIPRLGGGTIVRIRIPCTESKV